MSFSKDGHHPAQVLWQVGEVVMNAWILYAIVTAGLTLPLIIWTVFEVGMNAWILATMVKVRIDKRNLSLSLPEIHLRHYQCCNCLGDSAVCCVLACICKEE